MAHVIDTLWIQRKRGQLEVFAGPCQLGGVSGAVLLVLAVVVLAQARKYFGLSTFLVTLDLKWAFDMAPLDCMKLACMEAGLSLGSWLHLDAILEADRQCVQLHWLLSQVFSLGCGTAQGQRFSVHVFISMLKNETAFRSGPRASATWYLCDSAPTCLGSFSNNTES